MRYTLTLRDAQTGHAAIRGLWEQLKPLLLAGHRIELTAKTETRSSEQNARMWAMLSEVSAQVIWHGNKLTPEEWKDMVTAALKRQKVVPGIDGGFVVIGSSTSRMTKSEISELMDFLEAFGSQHGVMFSAPKYME